jgi:glycosyltransferase involved in cell wall biosynthesis
MKILMAIDYYRPHVSGLTLYAEHLAEGLARRGHAVRVLTHRHLPDLPVEAEENGVGVVRAPVAARIGKALVSPAILAHALAEIPRADVLHLHAPLVNAISFSTLATTLHVPAIVTFHCDLQTGTQVKERLVEAISRASQNFALDRSTRIITYTEDYARHTRPLSNRLEKVGWVRPPVPDPPRTGRTASEARERFGVRGGPVLLFLGRFAEEKGLPVLVDAFAAVRRRFPRAILLMAGAREVPGETVLERLRPMLEDPESGLLAPGIVPPAEVGDLFAIADVLVLPSINATESFGLVQIEAMLSGVPSVASDLPGVRQPVRLTGMGEIAPIGDPAGLARSILRVLEHPERYRRPREEIRALFSTDDTLAFYETTYAAAIRGGA